MTCNEVAPAAGPRQWIGLGVLCLSTLLVAIDTFVLLLALPRLSAALGADGVEQLWIADVYGFMLGGFLITMGSLGDRIGRRRLLLLGAASFGVGSVIAAYSTSPEMLIGARALMGIAGATLAPSTLGLIRHIFRDPRQMGVAIGVWASSFTIGAIIGPMIGGVLLAHYWWGSVFLVGVPAMLLLVVLGPLLLPEYRNLNAARPDWRSSILLLASILPVIYGVKELARGGWQPLPIVTIVVGLALGAVFLRRQRLLTTPLLDLRLFRNRSFTIPLLALFLQSSLTGTVLLFMTQHFQAVDGMSPWQAGLALLPGLALSSVFTPLAAVLARRIRPAHLIAAGEVLVIVGLVLVVLSSANTGPAMLVIGFAVWAVGGTPLLAVGITLIVGSAPPEKASTASSMPQISNELGTSFGVATMGSLGVALYHMQVIDSLPAQTPADIAGTASQSIANAVAVAGSLPADLAAAVLVPARLAYTNSLHLMAGITAVVLVGVIALFLVGLRHVRPLEKEEPAPQEGVPAAQ